MMRDPFKIDGPTAISFSGGRTSAYMLWRVLQSNGGLPADAVICFANTGREDEATLRFVRDCSLYWNVPIIWLEYRDPMIADANTKYTVALIANLLYEETVLHEMPDLGFAIVNYETASRNGEPFEALIKKRQYLPNPVTRFCTVELKIRTIYKYLKSKGMIDDGIDMMVGIRADEARRVAKMRNGRNSESAKINNIVPLADAGVTVRDVAEFWETQPFNLELPTYNGRTLAGNCDLCFLKPANQVLTLIKEKPARGIWWARMEALALALASKPSGAVFRSDRPTYAQMINNAENQGDLFDVDEEAIECFCGE